MQKNVDQDFKASDFIITEAEEGSNTPNLITLDMRLNVNGVMTKNFGYRVLCINKKAALITFIGEKNPDFDIKGRRAEAFRCGCKADGIRYG